jgi:hypothetical protein
MPMLRMWTDSSRLPRAHPTDVRLRSRTGCRRIPLGRDAELQSQPDPWFFGRKRDHRRARPRGGPGRSSPATGNAEDHRHNPAESADHKPDTAAQKDSNGFRNYGQYVARRVSEHLNIPLADLKKAIVDDNLSLGQAIHKLKPRLSTRQVETETKKAEAAAKKAAAEAKKKAD